MQSLVNWIDRVDRRVIYALIFICLFIPLVRPIGMPVGISPTTQMAFDKINSLKPGDIAILSPDFTPGTEAENLSQTVVFAHHLMSKGVRIIGLSMRPEGIMYAERVLTQLAPEYGYEYGKDYVVMPWKAGGESLVVAFAKDFQGTYPEDFWGKPTKGTLVNDVKSINDVAVIICMVTGDEMQWYLRQVEAIYKVPVTGGGTAVTIPGLMPFVASGQLTGVLSGLKGAAEYEKLIGKPGRAAAGMDAQSLSHIIVMLFIILGNVAHFYNKKKNKARRAN
ncbi:MAG: hypothetical protein AB1445_10810 [Bacillota bacterium]